MKVRTGGICMKFKAAALISGAVLIAAAVFVCLLFFGKDSSVNTASENSNVSYSDNAVLDSSSGASGKDIAQEVSNKAAGEKTIKLIGSFTLNDTIDLPSGITIEAQGAVIKGKAEKLFKCKKSSSIHIKDGTWELEKTSVLIDADNSAVCVFDGLTVEGGAPDGKAVISMNGVFEATVMNCIFKDTSGSAVSAVNSSDGLTVYNCSFMNCGGCAVTADSSDSVRMINNRISSGSGFSFEKCQSGIISGNDFTAAEKNDTKKKDCFGISLSACSNMSIGANIEYGGKNYSGNTFPGCSGKGISLSECDAVAVSIANISDTEKEGISITSSSRTTVEHCSFSGCGGGSVTVLCGEDMSLSDEMRVCSDTLLRNNIIEKSGADGIMLSGVEKARLLENDISGCAEYGISCISSESIYISDGNITGTKTKNDIGISCSDDCHSIDIDMPFHLDRTELTMGKGDVFMLDSNVGQLRWKTSNSSVADVINGKITARNIGIAEISAVTSGGKTASCRLTVKKPAESVSISSRSLELGEGEEYTLSASVPQGTVTAGYTFSSSDSSVLEMKETNDKGVFTARQAGTARIVVHTAGGKTDVCKVTVKSAPEKAQLSSSEMYMGVGETASLSVILGSDCAAQGRTFRSSDSSIIRMIKTDGQAQFTAVKPGTAYVTARLYNGVEAGCRITVRAAPASAALSRSEVALGVGESTKLSVKLPSGTASYTRAFSVSDSKVIQASSDGTIKAKAVGTAWVNVRLYNGVTAKCRVTVRKAPSWASLDSSHIYMKVGQEGELSAYISPDSASLSRTYRTSDSSIVQMTKTSWTGSFRALKPGTAYVTVRLYNGVEASCRITVTK